MKKVQEVGFLIFLRYRKANNEYLKCYDRKQEAKYITYLHTNDLNHYPMSKQVDTKVDSTDEIKRIDPEEFNLNKNFKRMCSQI